MPNPADLDAAAAHGSSAAGPPVRRGVSPEPTGERALSDRSTGAARTPDWPATRTGTRGASERAFDPPATRAVAPGIPPRGPDPRGPDPRRAVRPAEAAASSAAGLAAADDLRRRAGRGVTDKGIADREANTGRPGVSDRAAGPGDATGAGPGTSTSLIPRSGPRRGRTGAGAGSARAADRTGAGRGRSDRSARPGGPDGTDARYDTVDQAALRRIDIRERDAESTVYRKVNPTDAEADAAGGAAMTAVTPGRRIAGRRRDQPTRATEQMALRIGEREAADRRPVSDRTGTRRMTPTGAGPGRGEPTRAYRAAMDGPGGPDGPSGPGRSGRNGRSAQPPRPGQGRRGPMWWRRRPRWLRRLVLAGVFSSILLFVAGIAVVYAATQVPLPSQVKTAQTSIVYYGPPAGSNQDTGDEIARIGTVNRTDVPLAEVSKDMQHAVLAAEDKNFYHEPGISPKGIARALYVNLTGGDLQGGSTITQQYAKNAYLTQERTFTRKMREIALAVKLDQKYSKDQILEFYLNTIYFGRGAYGIEAASKVYFNTTAAKLTAEQGAVIAGLIRAPNYLDPAKNPAPAATRWHEVVATMAAEGWAPTSITSGTPPAVIPKVDDPTTSSAQVAYIRDEVKTELKNAGITDDQINRGGLRITTTIDKGRQMAAYEAVTNVLGTAYAAVPDLRTGLSAVEPGTGRVLAWYGGSLYGKDSQGRKQFEDNVSVARVQSGSTFKAITLVAALQKNINLKSTFAAPERVTLPGNYVVSNDEGDVGDLGYMNLIQATARSINTVYVPLAQNIGVPDVINTAHLLGIPENASLPVEAGLTLGKDPIHAIDMTGVYATLAANGVRATPHIVDKVVDGTGQVIYSGNPAAKQVIPTTVARDATYALQSVINDPAGTGTRAALAGGREAAGKTGTTTDFRSAWFCGYTKELSSCVNMFRGGGTSKELLKGIPGAENGVYGGTYPAKIWKAFMDAALQGVPKSTFDPPAFGGMVQDNEPAPTPTPTMSTAPTPGTGIDLGDLFNGGASGGTGGGQQPQQSPQPGDNRPRTRQTGVVVDPFS
ncbi:transglycosylase domain-containing protein [Frankia sp. AgB32]|uniref:transglycosylase domain-containing protein n=1 Tax=Frankia sp. AgB32 TaxID=631119 RepID=UPI00200FEBE3|nr:transglycosylase domain-containing protein [Frankia sp. AgB32]MCK9893279.1 transglycosylase domain-containing protein [Frankia sp. AgB32]